MRSSGHHTFAVYEDKDQNNMSDRFPHGYSYLGLQNINFGLQRPAKFTKKVRVSEKVRVYLACGGSNAGLVKRRGFDPATLFGMSTKPEATYCAHEAISGSININSNRPQSLYDKRYTMKKATNITRSRRWRRLCFGSSCIKSRPL